MKLYSSSKRFTHSSMVTVFSLLALATMPVQADEFSAPLLQHSQTDFGGTGLMQMPSARMMPEGELSLGVTNNDEYLHYHLSLQLFPWLETTVRYTQVHDLLYSSSESFSGDTEYTDKGFDVKLRALKESDYLPEVSIGLRDFSGTGLFDGEFIAASKHIGPFDFTLGLGWGYLGNRANLTGDKSSSADCERNSGYNGNGGSFDIDRLFTGCTSVFGGIEYQTPYAPLTLKVEYDGNDYRSDFPVTRGRISMPQATPWNFGAVYAMTDWAQLQLSYERGNTVTAGITMHTNLSTVKQTWVDDEPPTYHPHERQTTLSDAQWNKLTHDLSKVAGFSHPTIYQDGDVVTVTGSQSKYRERKEGEERAATLLANTGLDAKTYRFIELSQRQPITETRIDTASFKQVKEHDYPGARFTDARQTGNPVRVTGQKVAGKEKNLYYGIAPKLQQSFGGAEDFYLYSVGIVGGASYHLGDHWLLSGSFYGNITDNYDKFNYDVPPDGTNVKRVRTLNREYFSKTVRLDTLQVNYFDRLSTNVYGQAYAGYLESMYAGAGGELLYRPLGSNWALGVDANYVKQRDPDTYMGLYKEEQHYDSSLGRTYRVQTGVATGHATLYWQPKFWDAFDNTLVQISAGRYLAEDVGVTVDFSKQFASGVIAGVFATKTDMSAEEFGEGSFSKGFYVSIPLDIMTVTPSKNRTTISWLPLQRDGGQMLGRKYSLYGMTDSRDPWYARPPMY
ncbi:MAG: YjbH domain-containing protein [Vibrio sp.]